jgi:hypothetical protein
MKHSGIQRQVLALYRSCLTGGFSNAQIQFLAVRQARILACLSPSARILAWRTSRNQDLGAPLGGAPNLRFSLGTHVPKFFNISKKS